MEASPWNELYLFIFRRRVINASNLRDSKSRHVPEMTATWPADLVSASPVLGFGRKAKALASQSILMEPAAATALPLCFFTCLGFGKLMVVRDRGRFPSVSMMKKERVCKELFKG